MFKEDFMEKNVFEMDGFLYFKTDKKSTMAAVQEFLNTAKKIGIGTEKLEECELRSKKGELFVTGTCLWHSNKNSPEEAMYEFHERCAESGIMARDMMYKTSAAR